MAYGGVGSNTVYCGTVEHVVKNYGFIRLDGGSPVFFDKTSVGGALDDLTEQFKKGCRIKTRIENTDGENKVQFKALALQLANQSDSSIRGGDQYLKNYLDVNGPMCLDVLAKDLSDTYDNCPRFLRTGDTEDIRRVVAARPDLFEIKNNLLCLAEAEINIKNTLLNSMAAYDSKIPLSAIRSIFNCNHPYHSYLLVDEGYDGVKDFVSANAGCFIFWDDKIWKRDYILDHPHLRKEFQQELKAVNYYSQFVDEEFDYHDFDCDVLSITSLSGHWHQANHEVKQVVRPREAEFREFLCKNSFFFNFDAWGDIECCPGYRLSVMDTHWSGKASQNQKAKFPSSPPVSNDLQRPPPRSAHAPLPTQNNPNQGDQLSAEAVYFYMGMSWLPPGMRAYTHFDNRGRGGEEYLERYLPGSGAKPLLLLIDELWRKNDPNCPIFLKYGHFQELCDLARQTPEKFSIRQGYFCLNSLEDQLVHDIFSQLRNPPMTVIPMSDLRSKFSSSTQPGKYLFAPAGNPHDSIKDFLYRNAKWFVVWENTIYSSKDMFGNVGVFMGWLNSFEGEMRAVKYYSKYIQPAGTEIISLRGHDGQAPPNVQSACDSDEESFKDFLKNNYFFFDVMNDVVRLGNKDRLKVIDDYWLNERARAEAVSSAPPNPITAVQMPARHPLPNALPVHPQAMMTSLNAQGFAQILFPRKIPFQANTPTKAPAHSAQALSIQPRATMASCNVQGCAPTLLPLQRPFQDNTLAKTPVQALSVQPRATLASHNVQGCAPTPVPQKRPFQPNTPTKPPVQVSKAFSDMEGEVNLRKTATRDPASESSHSSRLSFGTSFHLQPSLLRSQDAHDGSFNSSGLYSAPEARVFKNLIGDFISREIEDEIRSTATLNSLLLIRFNIGKPPMAKFRIPGEAGGFNHTLKADPVNSEDVQRLLRQDEVLKMATNCHYGVKGTLHSIRTMERGGKLIGLTLFCQLHEVNDGLSLDVWKRRKLTAVFTGNYPVKYIYNHLRCKCEKLSKSGDVLVIDVDGQLSGCDEIPFQTLENVTRMPCLSSSELTQAITDSIQHMHEYVVVIGIDDAEHLKALQKMCNKGTEVIAEVSSELKGEVEKLFT